MVTKFSSIPTLDGQSKEIIIACSTSIASNAALAVIRLNGFEKLEQFFSILRPKTKKIRPRLAFQFEIIFQNEVVDSGVGLYWKGPASFTGENTLELTVHGNLFLVKKILDLFLETIPNLRLARPGEFTYRALINKKMNLLQVEGLDLVLNANSPFTLQHGNQLLKGAVFSSYIDFHQKFLHLRSAGELLLDFSEDIGELEGDIQFKNALFAFKEVIEGLYNRICNKSQALLNGEVVIYGPTNAGKSTFFNKILGIERAITSPIEGTTRDFIREDLNIKGNFFKIVDTAGLRALSDDPLEKIGMGMGRKVLEGAFFKILVLNPFLENWEGCLEEVSQQAESLDLLIFSHFDRDGFSEQKNMIQKRFSSLLRPIPSLNLSFVNDAFEINFMPGPIGPEKGMGEIFRANSFGSGPIGPVNGEIVDSLSFEMAGPIGPEAISFIKGMIFSKYEKEVSLDPIIIERHRQCLKKAYKMFESILRLQANGEDFGIIMHELTQLQGIIEELIGIIPAEQVLNNIFDNFCIGK